MLHRDTPALVLLCLALAACGPTPEPAPPPVEAAVTPPADPVAAALSGSARRALERHHPNAHVIMVDQVFSRGIDQAKVCGRYLLLTRDTRREQFFIVSATEMLELRRDTDRRWIEACADGTPLPGGLDTVGAEAEVAKLTYR